MITFFVAMGVIFTGILIGGAAIAAIGFVADPLDRAFWKSLRPLRLSTEQLNPKLADRESA